MSTSLIDPAILFRFEFPLRHDGCEWSTRGLQLPEACRLPNFSELAGARTDADLRMAWNEQGLGLRLQVRGKRQAPWCRDTRLDASDGLHLCLDTRCSPGIHRATQYCHRFVWMPSGGGARREAPLAALVPINRARSQPRPIGHGQLKIVAGVRHDGYELSGWIPATALTGYDPTQQPRISLNYLIFDRELGCQSLAIGTQYPQLEDPSLWTEVVLAPKE